MSKRFIALLIVMAAAGLAVAAVQLFTGQPAKDADPEIPAAGSRKFEAVEDEVRRPPKNEPAKNDPAAADEDSSAPTRSKMREEAEVDADVLPSLQLFANKMAMYMEQALVSEGAARNLFPQLAECALDEGDRLALSVRATCLVNASRLSSRYPGSFEDDYHSLEDRMPQDVKNLVNALRGS
ncbi:MAG: hypothetical protein A2583_08510 [Bdellovibrionales bacterium RIFOXYD1_FULL_53_11]|nr:MAG: hypothetical protein A2583_08510 [Bdellovibrionales bacterium RIFOXYD1_FULL_53_11]